MKITELRLSSLFYPIDRSKEIHLPIETPFKVCTIGFKVEAIPYDKVPAQVEKWTEFNPNDLSPNTLQHFTKIGVYPKDEAILSAEFAMERYVYNGA